MQLSELAEMSATSLPCSSASWDIWVLTLVGFEDGAWVLETLSRVTTPSSSGGKALGSLRFSCREAEAQRRSRTNPRSHRASV